MSTVRITGGCQCGAVRYALLAEPDNPQICHCRMCQKAFGSIFAPLTSVPPESFELTRGRLAIFRSSDPAERGFCRDCGTPLTVYTIGDSRIFVAIGSLDDPEAVEPKKQYGIEGRMSWFGKLASLPGDKTSEQEWPTETARIAASNHQHPDHETAVWPPRGDAP